MLLVIAFSDCGSFVDVLVGVGEWSGGEQWEKVILNTGDKGKPITLEADKGRWEVLKNKTSKSTGSTFGT